MRNKLKLWYKEPAREWVEYLPLGNGKLGAMVSGDVYNDRIALNEDTLWTGIPCDKNNYESINYLDEVRNLILNEKYYEAQELMNSKLLAGYTESYVPLGDLYLNFPSNDKYEDYTRELDLNTAIVTTKYRINSINYKREAFVSGIDNAIIVRISSDNPNSINLTIGLKSLLKSKVLSEGEDTLVLKGVTPIRALPVYVNEEKPIIYSENSDDEMRFQSTLRVRANDGDIYEKDGVINVKNASDVTLILVANTSFNGFDKSPGIEGKDESILCYDQIDKIESIPYRELLSRHIEDYQKLFSRVEFSLGNDDFSNIPTNERLEKLREGKEDLGLISLYFQYGRYLLISSSRRGSQPANLQGIWNEDLRPAWSSNYTVNINTEMNYWAAEVCNLSECHEPLLNMLSDLSITGSKTAKEMFNCNGWVANHNVDLWRYSSTVAGSSEWGFWPMGGAWLCQHLWEHYDFTRDKKFLKNEAYPIMKGAAQFLLDYLIQDKSGSLVTCPSTSPENNFLDDKGRKCCASMMSTMDISIIRDLFNNCILAIDILKYDKEFKKTLMEIIGKMPAYKINKFGAIQEWFKDFDEYEPGHRHMSHLFALYPGREITKKKTPSLYEASKKTLERRLGAGGGHTGWSCAWIINFYARLKEADLANEYLHVLLKNLTFINLFCVHPPFQIDGNFGGTAGIAEMIIQSHEEAIEILPSIPSSWSVGSVKGLKARGGFIVNFKWDKNKIIEFSIESTVGGKCKINFGKWLDKSFSNDTIEIDTIAGTSYRLK
ncbi:glycoside hydrolase family 95 protein [Clostridium sp. D53t1_180928_C8]|uniref:glycoside hydrolase family 95 protein n=1 Tax=Clostridium sp. D53t1_180928_C8 TaxID=2787101 RepID=UPI0018A923A5|nr:glycoside hydrolase family 95 protein [Clostridium sp. D53t1_180928_C8]